MVDKQIRNKNLANKLKTLIIGIAIMGILYNTVAWFKGLSKNALIDNTIGLVVIIAFLSAILLFVSLGSNKEE